MAGSVPKVYNFLSEENVNKWKGLLHTGLKKIQKQVHPRLDIEDDAVIYLEMLIFRLLAQMCATQPHTLDDVEAYVQRNFASPIDAWALSDAKLMMERAQRRKGVFSFPVEKIFPMLQKDVFGYKVELPPVQFIMAILDYISADILKLGGQFAKNTRKPALVINQYDIRVSMAADPALQVLFQPLQGGHKAEMIIPTRFDDEPTEPRTLSYDDHLRDLIDEERKYVRHLNLIMKVFMEPFQNKNLFSQQDVDDIFGEISDLHELSVQLVGSLEECIEMAGEMQGARCPQAGFVFEELAESFEFEVYLRYAQNYMEALAHFDNLMEDEEVVKHFESQPTKLFKEAMQYLLPKSLLEPIYHCFYYFEVLDALAITSKTNDDREALNSSIACMLGLKSDMERECSRFLTSKSREDSGIFSKRQGYQITMKKVAQLQEKIEGWEGVDITACCTELIMEGVLGVTRESRKSSKNERHVFLLDGLTVCCRARAKGGVKDKQYRFKEKINMRKVTLVDLPDSDDLKFAFQLVEPDQPAYIFYAITNSEKRDWMSALTQLLTKSTFDRLLDAKLREEEKTIPILRPDSNKYKFADEDSDETILFDDPEGEKSITGPGPLIKAGTIHKLVERLTYHEYADPNLVRTFLMTYRSFCQPNELLDLLVERYKIPNPDGIEDKKDPISMKAMKTFKTTYQTPIQLRVLNVLRHWVEFHYYDFERDPKLLEKLEEFVGSVRSRNMQKWVTSIHRALKKKKDEGGSSVSKSVVFNKEPAPVEWYIARNRDEYNLLTLHPLEIARQLTLILSDYFRAIHPSELVDASWMKEQKKETASPNLLKLSRFETKMSNWLTMEIVSLENFEERVALVSRLVDVMSHLKDLNNFSGMFIINAAFESASVFRLSQTKKAVRRQQILEDMKQIASSDNNFKNYRDRLRNINPPCVPFVGMYLSWIVFIRDGQENTIPGKPDHFINFRKRRKIADVLQEIQQYQNSPYCLQSEQSIQDYILSQDPVGEMTTNQWEDHVFEMSRAIEPKDAPPKKAPRKFKFELRPPDSRGGTLVGTLMGRRSKAHAPVNTIKDGQQDGGEENSPGPSSAPNSPSPFTSEGGASGSINGTLEKSRKGSIPGSGTSTPPRPPKPTKTSSCTELPPLPSSPSLTNSGSPAPILPPRPRGYGKPPPPPLPNNDAPPLPPRLRDETPPPVFPPSPANPIPLPPRENPPPPRVPRRQKESPPPPIPPKGLQGQC